jgi:hypothetical protein
VCDDADMPYGVVLLPTRRVHEHLVSLATTVGGADPVSRLGPDAPAHLSVVHFDADAAQAGSVADRAARHPVQRVSAAVIGLLYAAIAPGDYYVPQGGVYFGIEVVRQPALDALHREVLTWVHRCGARPLGAVDADYRPHVTLGVSAGRPTLPDLADVPTGTFDLTLAFGELGPYGTFPGLARLLG